jgi:DNA-binding transcriptional MerR regulator
MGHPAVSIPEKIFFKIGEVCDIVDVQAHVLRYWETEFSMLSPQKNRSGQRSYRRRDVEIALRIKELLYDELYTIAGAKKKLQSELREASRLKVVPGGLESDPDFLPSDGHDGYSEAFGDTDEDLPMLELEEEVPNATAAPAAGRRAPTRREAVEELANHLLELREMLSNKRS